MLKYGTPVLEVEIIGVNGMYLYSVIAFDHIDFELSTC